MYILLSYKRVLHFFIFNCNFTILRVISIVRDSRKPFCVDSYFVELKKMIYIFISL